MKRELWQAKDIYSVLDKDGKGWISLYDVEKLLTSPVEVTDIELLIGLYDLSG